MADKGIKISEELESIIDNLIGKEFLINPFFRISKSTPEQLTPYKYISMKYSRELLALNLIVCLPINLIKIILQIFLSLFFSYQYLYFKSKDQPTEVLFLSHAIGANITNRESDQFFALMPEYCANKKLNTTVVYTNHNKLGYITNVKTLILKSANVNRVLIPKFLKPKELLKYMTTIFRMFVKCVRFGVILYFANPTYSKILFSAANSFFSRPTYANYLLLLRIKDVCLKNEIRIIFMTFEGHSYEQYVANQIHQLIPNLKMVFYQHSPITPAHMGVRHFLQNNIDNLLIMTTGTYYINFLKKISDVPDYILIGSNKAEHLQENKGMYESKTLLFAPEGTVEATKSFLKLIRLMNKKDHTHRYLLRLHPNLPRSVGVYLMIRNLKKFKNFTLSNSSLSTDLNLSKFVFYRSSVVGLQALNSNAAPIFYPDPGFNMLNVIPPNLKIFHTVSTLQDAFNIINNNDNQKLIHNKQMILESLFSKLMYQNLDDILIKN